MSIRYRYSMFVTYIPMVVFLIIPAIGIAQGQNGLSTANLVYWFFMLAFTVITVIWIINRLSVRIEVNEVGLVYKSICGEKKLPWNHITDVHHSKMASLLEPGFFISTSDGNKICIYNDLQRCDGAAGGIIDLESTIKERVGPINLKKQEIKEIKKYLRLAVIAGLLSLLFGAICVIRPPISLADEKLGIISIAIGASADGIALMICGITLTVIGLYQLKKR